MKSPTRQNPEWNDLIQSIAQYVPADSEIPGENAEMVDAWANLDEKYRGCVIFPYYFNRASEDVWSGTLYLGGRVRVIMKGTLYQCARFRDAAYYWFSKYRTKRAGAIDDPANYNFSPAQAKRDNAHPDFINMLSLIEKHLEEKEGVDFKTDFMRLEARAHNRAAYRKSKFTLSGRIEARLDLHTDQLDKAHKELNARLKHVEDMLSALTTQLAIAVPNLPRIAEAGPDTADILHTPKLGDVMKSAIPPFHPPEQAGLGDAIKQVMAEDTRANKAAALQKVAEISEQLARDAAEGKVLDPFQ